MCCGIIFCTDVTTGPSSKSDGLWNTGVIAGIAAALVLLLILIVVALYINYHHPHTASPLYLIQVSSGCVPNLSRTRARDALIVHVLVSPNFFYIFVFIVETQKTLAFLEVSEATVQLHRSGGRRSWKGLHCWSWASLKWCTNTLHSADLHANNCQNMQNLTNSDTFRSWLIYENEMS